MHNVHATQCSTAAVCLHACTLNNATWCQMRLQREDLGQSLQDPSAAALPFHHC